MTGILYLIPSLIGSAITTNELPEYNKQVIRNTKYFVVEDLRSARRFLKLVDKNIVIDDLQFGVLNEHTKPFEVFELLKPILNGTDCGIISEAGCPGIADPGAALVNLAHKHNINVVPLVGPSSVILALMASGMNGQNFAFNGYLPVEPNARISAIKKYEKRAYQENQSQIFIETPYRNNHLFHSFVNTCLADTLLCVAINLMSESQLIKSKTIKQWKLQNIEIEKVPAVFIIMKP